MRHAWLVVAILALPALGGCLGAFRHHGNAGSAVGPANVGYDPSEVRVTGVLRSNMTIESFDGTQLSAVLYEPITSDTAPGGQAPHWGTVVFLHGWGEFKEVYEGAPGAAQGAGAPVPGQVADAASAAPFGANRLKQFAENGLIAVAYDARGFGQSGGTATVAGPAEAKDLDAVMDYVAAHEPSNGLFGVVGESYGGGQGYNAFADDPRVVTAVPMYGWVDLYHGLAPGNVPKAEWAALLGGLGAAGSHARVDPMLAQWYQDAVTRTDLQTVQAQMDLRSSLPRLGQTTKPLYLCQGLQESLFPQADLAWENAGGFTRATLFTGGHGADNAECWSKALDWMRYFVGGYDTGVAKWPALTTPDADAGAPVTTYDRFPVSTWQASYLRAPELSATPSNATFTVAQRLVANPLNEPSAVWDQAGQPTNAVPEQFRQDPGGLFFSQAPLSGGEVLLGAPTLTLHLASDNPALPFQVVGTLYHVDGKGNSQLLTRAAFAALQPSDVANGTVTLRFDWTKATLSPKDQVVLKLDANDESVFLPLMANYAVDFTGLSELRLPLYAPSS